MPPRRPALQPCHPPRRTPRPRLSCQLRPSSPSSLSGAGPWAGPPPPLQLLALAPDVDGVGSTPHRAIGCWLGLQPSAAKCGENGLWLWGGATASANASASRFAVQIGPNRVAGLAWPGLARASTIHPRRPAYASCHGSACRRPSGSRPACSKPPGRPRAAAFRLRDLAPKNTSKELGCPPRARLDFSRITPPRAATRQASFSSSPPTRPDPAATPSRDLGLGGQEIAGPRGSLRGKKAGNEESFIVISRSWPAGADDEGRDASWTRRGERLAEAVPGCT